MASSAAGWGEALTILKFFVETGQRYRGVPWDDLSQMEAW
jgi:hypothetical protein